METPKPIAGSFRDPAGRVYEHNGQIFRTVNRSFVSEFDFVESTGLLDLLIRQEKLLGYHRSDKRSLPEDSGEVEYVLEVPKIPFVSFPYEWSFSALKAAALLHLEIHLCALEFGVTLSDSSAYNIQFLGTNPVFIDHLSFIPYKDGDIWVGHRQFCEQFLNPLLLRSLFGLSHNAWYRGTQEGISATDVRRLLRWHHLFRWNLFTHVFLQSILQRSSERTSDKLDEKYISRSSLSKPALSRILKGLHNWIESLYPADSGKTVWSNYENEHSYTRNEGDIKRQFVSECVRSSKPSVLWDLGCNTGDYSKIALDAGATYVLGFDFDLGALDVAYARASKDRCSFLPLFLDASNPSPDQGWRQEERPGLVARANANCLIALAFVHHLAIAKNIRFDSLLEWMLSLAPIGVIEFVPKTDVQVKRLLAFREDIFPDYNEEFFLSYISKHAKIIKKRKTSEEGRLLVWYDKIA